MTDPSQTDRVTEICVACRFGTGESRDCTLIGSGRLDVLIEQGPCRLDRRLRSQVKVEVDRDHPEMRQQVSLLAEKAVFALMRLESFPKDQIRALPAFLIFLERFAHNYTLDSLVAQGRIDDPTCGQCRHFEADRGCTLAMIPTPAGAEANPWAGPAVQADTKPRRLDPACESFVLPALTAVDLLGDVLDGQNVEVGVAAVFRAMDAIAADSDDGLVEAILLRRHALEGEDLVAIAEQAEVTPESLAAVLGTGRARLGDLLLPPDADERPEKR